MSYPSPIACDLTVLNEEERQEHQQNSEVVFNSIQDIRESSKGYAFRLPNHTDTLIRSGAFVARERLCCPFFHFVIEVEPDHGAAWLKVSGREGVKQYIRENVLPVLKTEAETTE